MTQKYIQVGQMALRDPITREPLKAQPIFMLAEDVGVINKSGLTDTEEKACESIAETLQGLHEMFANTMKHIEAEEKKMKAKRKKRIPFGVGEKQ